MTEQRGSTGGGRKAMWVVGGAMREGSFKVCSLTGRVILSGYELLSMAFPPLMKQLPPAVS